MNREPARKAADKLYTRMIFRVLHSIAPFLGLPTTSETLKDIANATRALVQASRKTIQNLAYEDYSSVVGGTDLVPKIELKRFTEGLWQGVVEKAAEDYEHVTPVVAQEIGMQADRWTRDAEWGTRLDLADKDPRIGGWARVDFEPPTCPWCTLLNSRGPVYQTGETGAATLHNGDTCTLIFVPRGSKKYEGMDHTAEAEKRYKAARKTAGTGDSKDILRELRNQGETPTGRVRKNAEAATKQAAEGELKAVKARIKTLEGLNPKSESARKYRDTQLARNQKQLSILDLESKNHE